MILSKVDSIVGIKAQTADPANKLARTLLPIPLDQRYEAQDILTCLGKIL